MAANTLRKDAPEKVSGQAKYVMDCVPAGAVYAWIVPSAVAFGEIKQVEIEKAKAASGVLAVLKGGAGTPMGGPLLLDRPLLATGRVRYAGEPLALVVAQSLAHAQAAAKLIRAHIEAWEPVADIQTALSPGAPLLHPEAPRYTALAEDVKPRPGTNIAASFQIRKGDPASQWQGCAQIVEESYTLPYTLHAAMEPRGAIAQYRANGTLKIISATQAPFAVREMVAMALDMEPGQVEVEVPYVGGGYGGKSAVMAEYLAALAARAVPGRPVCLALPREQDAFSAPGRMAMTADLKLGADGEGRIKAAQMRFFVDAGAYSDIAPNMAKAVAVDCSGPYVMDHLFCDVQCVYTNHTYATAFRGFGHESYTFCLERALDTMAERLGMDKLAFRLKNAIHPGRLTPTQVEITPSNGGNVAECIRRLRKQMNWQAGERAELGNGIIRAKGAACLWKTPTTAADASAGAVITFNDDGSVNLAAAVVEMGNGGQTRLAQMVARELSLPIERVYVTPLINTRAQPKYFKTVASLSNYLAGRAALSACADAMAQLKANASLALGVPAEDLLYGQGRVFVKHQPKFSIGYQDLCMGVTQADGSMAGKPVIGRGSAVTSHIGPLAKDTGKGRTGHAWTVGAQGVEVELDTKDMTYRLVKAVTVMDVGGVLDRAETCALIRGGMSMGLSLARGEACALDAKAFPATTSLRTYKLLHIGEEPHYVVELVATPQTDAPYGLRSHSEHGLVGMPAALGNALSTALGVPLNALPLTPERLYYAAQAKEGTR